MSLSKLLAGCILLTVCGLAGARAWGNIPGTYRSEGPIVETWIIKLDHKVYSCRCIFTKGGVEIGSCHGENVHHKTGLLTFTRVFDKKPFPDVKDNMPCQLKLKVSTLELFVMDGQPDVHHIYQRDKSARSSKPEPEPEPEKPAPVAPATAPAEVNKKPTEVTSAAAPPRVEPHKTATPVGEKIKHETTTHYEKFKLPPNVANSTPAGEWDVKLHIAAMDVSRNGRRVAFGSQQIKDFPAGISVWDLQTQKQVWIDLKLGEQVLEVRHVAFSGDGKILAAEVERLSNPELRFYNASTGQLLRNPPPSKIRIQSIGFHPTRPLLAIGTSKFATHGTLELIDTTTGKTLWSTQQIHHTSIDGIAWSPAGDIIATCGRKIEGKGGNCVKLIDAAKGKIIQELVTDAHGIVHTAIFSGDGKLLAAQFGDMGKPAVVIWDVATRLEIRRITDIPGGTYGCPHTLAFLADNKTLAVAGWDRHLHLFDTTTGERIGVFAKAYGISVDHVFAVGDRDTLLTNQHTEIVRVWKRSEATAWPLKELEPSPGK